MEEERASAEGCAADSTVLGTQQCPPLTHKQEAVAHQAEVEDIQPTTAPHCPTLITTPGEQQTEREALQQEGEESQDKTVAHAELRQGEVEESEGKTLSHTELRQYFEGALSHLLKNDPILADLHPQVTLEEVNALVELEHGRAMKVYVEKADGCCWAVVVPREATLHHFKLALRHHVALSLARKGIKKKVSWKHIWKTNWLSYNDEMLRDDNTQLLQYGIRHRAKLRFIKRYRDRQKVDRRKGRL